MPGGYLYGWYSTGSAWVKIACNAAGKIIADVSAIFENPPTEDEANKGPSSEWAFDHNANVAAHHAKYTDVEARAAISDVIGADGHFDADMQMDWHELKNLSRFILRNASGDINSIYFTPINSSHDLRMRTWQTEVGWVACSFSVYDGTLDRLVITEATFQANLALFLEETPTNGVVNKAPTSNWAFDHDADAAAHHTKYTNAEAQAACNLDGNLYWSCPGSSFKAFNPDTDDVQISSLGSATATADGISFVAPVYIPDGATVTGAIAYGNAAATAETWTLRRVKLTDATWGDLATANIGTEDTTIGNAVIDNSLYAYFFTTSSLDSNDTIYGARITYTL